RVEHVGDQEREEERRQHAAERPHQTDEERQAGRDPEQARQLARARFHAIHARRFYHAPRSGYAPPRMPRIDLYLSHLVRHDAEGIVLSSGTPVTFRFPSGERHSNTSVDHAQVTHLVQEIAPRDALDQLTRRGHAKFPYKGMDGTQVVVDVEAKDATHWKVVIAPGTMPAASRKSMAPGRMSKAPARRKSSAGMEAVQVPG